MNFFKILFSKNKTKYSSIYDESSRLYEVHYPMRFFKPCKEIFETLIRTSLSIMKNKISMAELKTNIILINENIKYKITKYEINKIYELETKINGNIHWTTFEVIKCTPTLTIIYYYQKVFYQKIIAGAPGKIAKKNFKRDVKIKAQKIYQYLLQESKKS